MCDLVYDELRKLTPPHDKFTHNRNEQLKKQFEHQAEWRSPLNRLRRRYS